MFYELFTNLSEKNNSSNFILNSMNKGMIPISPKTFERIFGDQVGYYFHSSEIDNIDTLKKIGKSRKTISAFTEIGNYSIFTGAFDIELDFPVVSILNGKYALKTPLDSFTEYGDSGRRWVDPYTMNSSKPTKYLRKISDEITDKLKKEFGTIDIYSDIENTRKKELIKRYYEISEEILLKNKKVLEEISNMPLTDEYNEVLGYSFKIIKSLVTYNSFYRFVAEELNMNPANDSELNNLAKEWNVVVMKDNDELYKELKKYQGK